MEINDENLHTLRYHLDQINSGKKDLIDGAEKFLRCAETTPGFAALLLHLICSDKEDDYTRLAGAIYFKNFLKRRWVPREDERDCLSEEERNGIKHSIVEFMLSVPGPLVEMISESLKIISLADFPAKWGTLLPELVSKISMDDFNTTNGVLKTISSVVAPYEHVENNEANNMTVQMILDNLQEPLLQLFREVTKLIGEHSSDEKALFTLFTSSLYLCKIFAALNGMDIPAYFEDNLEEFMGFFHNYVTYRTDLEMLVEAEDGSEAPGVIHELQRQVCDNVTLYIQKHEEEIQPFLQQFVRDVWELLVAIPEGEKHELLVTSGVKFLSSVSKSVYFEVFSDEDTLKQVCERIVIPNMRFTEQDEDNFQDAPVEYIRRDIEGSDWDTRRRAACDLIMGLRKNFEKEVTGISSAYIGELLSEYEKGGEDAWKAKDVAIFLVTALTVTTGTQRDGALTINELVPIGEFFENEILPELARYPEGHMVIHADCLKFVSVFRNQIPSEALGKLFTCFIEMLGSDVYVVNTYAAGCIDKYLAMKEAGGKTPRIPVSAVREHSQTLFRRLFGVLERPASENNEYLMKAVVRVVAVMKGGMKDMAGTLIDQVAKILDRVARNPSQPMFNHYLFEALAALIRGVAGEDASTVPAFEEHLFPIFKLVLENNVSEFTPYVFQIMALLLECHPSGVTEAYEALLPNLMIPEGVWETSEGAIIEGNVPPLVRLIEGYLRKDAEVIVRTEQLEPLLGVFQRLLASTKFDHCGFEILQCIIETLPGNVFGRYLAEIFRIIFRRLKNKMTDQLCTSFCVFLGVFFAKHNGSNIIGVINDVQDGIFQRVVTGVLLSHANKVAGSVKRKAVALGLSRLLVVPEFCENYGGYWCDVLVAAVTILETDEEEADQVVDEQMAFTNVFCPLAHAVRDEHDPFADVNPRAALAKLLSEFSQKQSIIGMVRKLPEHVGAALMGYGQAAGLSGDFIQ